MIAPEGAAPDFCNEGDGLITRRHAFEAWAAMRELERVLPPPTAILAGRDCVLAELAAEMAAATLGDPAFAGGDEVVPTYFATGLEGIDLPAQEEASASQSALGGLILALPQEDDDWFVIVTTPAVIEAFTGKRPGPGSVTLYDRTRQSVLGTFSMQVGP